MLPALPYSPPLPPPFSSFLLGLQVHTQHHTSPSPFIPPFFFSLPDFPQSCCSVCHCMIVILTTHSHNAAFFPSPPLFPPSHSQHASRLHLDARLHPHEKKGCWQHHLKRTFSQKSTPPFLQHLPVPHVCEHTTLQLLCATRRHNHLHNCKAHFLTRLPASRTQPVPAITTMGIAAALLCSPSFFCCSPATNGAVSSTCEVEECDATRHNSTRG